MRTVPFFAVSRRRVWARARECLSAERSRGVVETPGLHILAAALGDNVFHARSIQRMFRRALGCSRRSVERLPRRFIGAPRLRALRDRGKGEWSGVAGAVLFRSMGRGEVRHTGRAAAVSKNV